MRPSCWTSLGEWRDVLPEALAEPAAVLDAKLASVLSAELAVVLGAELSAADDALSDAVLASELAAVLGADVCAILLLCAATLAARSTAPQ